MIAPKKDTKESLEEEENLLKASAEFWSAHMTLLMNEFEKAKKKDPQDLEDINKRMGQLAYMSKKGEMETSLQQSFFRRKEKFINLNLSNLTKKRDEK